MPVRWTNDDPALPLPDWLQAAGGQEFHTYMAQIVLLLRPAGLKRLRAKLAKAADQILLVPHHGGCHAMRVTTELDVMPKAGDWMRVSFDVMFDAPMARTMNIASKTSICGDDANGIGSNPSGNCAVAPPARAKAA
jgi:hypothetical protein